MLFTDEVRPDAADTVEYFLRENVRPKVISGDNPVTVAAIARRCNVPDADRYIDARELPDDPAALAEVADATAVFGRVTPEAKRTLLHALQGRDEVVAMTGDGVNDTLALKDADLGIAMGSGTPAAKSVSDIVLLDNRFATLPSVVAEGRRVIANIERVARLFLTKTAWAAVLAVLTGVLLTRYPLRPRHLTVVDALTIGIPGFVLSFQPSHDPVRPGFVRRVLRFSIPCGVIMGVATMFVYEFAQGRLDQTIEEAQSGAALTLIALGLWVLFELARPLDRLRARAARRPGGDGDRCVHDRPGRRLLPPRDPTRRRRGVDRRRGRGGVRPHQRRPPPRGRARTDPRRRCADRGRRTRRIGAPGRGLRSGSPCGRRVSSGRGRDRLRCR